MKFSTFLEKALLFHKNEKSVIKVFDTDETPLSLSQKTGIPRPTVYTVLVRLKNRGLIETYTKGKRIYWRQTDTTLSSHENTARDSVRIYTKPTDIVELFEKFARNSDHRLKALLGNHIGEPWRKALGEAAIVKANQVLKDKGIITEVISSHEPYEHHAEFFGKKWVDSYTGRPFKVSILDESYFDHNAQIFLYGPKTLIVNMEKKLAVEIHDAQISKMFDLIFKFIQDQTHVTNIEEKIRGMVK